MRIKTVYIVIVVCASGAAYWIARYFNSPRGVLIANGSVESTDLRLKIALYRSESSDYALVQVFNQSKRSVFFEKFAYLELKDSTGAIVCDLTEDCLRAAALPEYIEFLACGHSEEFRVDFFPKQRLALNPGHRLRVTFTDVLRSVDAARDGYIKFVPLLGRIKANNSVPATFRGEAPLVLAIDQ